MAKSSGSLDRVRLHFHNTPQKLGIGVAHRRSELGEDARVDVYLPEQPGDPAPAAIDVLAGAMSPPNFPIGPSGLGITALFSGPSGTGKTLAAEVASLPFHPHAYARG